MKRVLFISPTLGGGGAERVLSYIITWLAREKDYDITLLLLNKFNNNYLRTIPNNVKVEFIELGNKLNIRGFKIIKFIYKLKPTICFTGYYKLNLLLAIFIPFLKIQNIKFIVRETCIPSIEYNHNKYILKFLYKRLINRYDHIICQSIDMYNDMEMLGIKKSKMHIINNPIIINDNNTVSITDQYCKLENMPHLIAIGRLTEQKGYDILIHNLIKMQPNIPFRLTILGKGPLYKHLHSLIVNNNLNNYIELKGFTEDPYSFIKNSYGIILSSRYEGFPNVLLEANYFGKPIFANRCPGGINEIIQEGINGYTADFNNFDEFNKIIHLFLKTNFNNELIHELTVKRYSADIILPKFKNLFEKAIN